MRRYTPFRKPCCGWNTAQLIRNLTDTKRISEISLRNFNISAVEGSYSQYIRIVYEAFLVRGIDIDLIIYIFWPLATYMPFRSWE